METKQLPIFNNPIAHIVGGSPYFAQDQNGRTLVCPRFLMMSFEKALELAIQQKKKIHQGEGGEFFVDFVWLSQQKIPKISVKSLPVLESIIKFSIKNYPAGKLTITTYDYDEVSGYVLG